jgi:hypothetical protein
MSTRTYAVYSVLAFVLALSLAAVAIADAAGDTAQKARLRSTSNLRQLNEALTLYANENRGHFPRDLPQLEASDDYVKELNRSPYADPAKPEGFTYLITSARYPLDDDRPIAIDAAALDLEDGANVLFASGKVEWLSRAKLDELAQRAGKQFPQDVPLNEVLKRPALPDAQRQARLKAFAEQMAKLEMPAMPTKAFFTTDDGATWFADDIDKVPPFDKDGKMAVRAHVFRCGHGKTFVDHLERYTPQAKRLLEQAGAENRTPDADPELAAAVMNYQVKRPGGQEWVPINDVARSMQITTVRCPEGTQEVEPVFPD